MSRTAILLGAVIFILIENVISKDLRTEDHRDVVTQSGVVRGEVSENREYFAFLGIPYAAPPTGNNRFKAPLPPEPWNGVFEANRRVVCPQEGVGDEDCLIVNVFTPTRQDNESIPVLVYMHGGSFRMGSGQTQGVEPLTKHNIIVVTLNYRLGVLGFLCLGTEDAPGNAGLKDQAAALHWVKNNIKNFGGDPDQITIYGMSAGAASVEYQVLVNSNAGLFQRAIVESASATAVWTTDADPIKTAMNMAAALNLPPEETSNLNELVSRYRQIPAETLSQVNGDYYRTLIDGTFGFVPCVERRLNNTEPFLTESSYDILNQEKYHKIPMMFLFATLEGLNLRSAEYYELNYKERMESNFVDFVPADLIFDTEEIKHEVANNVRDFYFGNKTIGNDTIVEYLNYFGDYMVMHGLLNSVEIHSRNGNPVYLLEFSYRGNMGNYDAFYETINFAGHGDVVRHAILRAAIENDNDQIAVDRMSELIANYVKFGNPTPNRTELLPILWPTVNPSNVSSLHMNLDFQIIEEPYRDRKSFWDNLHSMYRRDIKPLSAGLL